VSGCGEEVAVERRRLKGAVGRKAKQSVMPEVDITEV
jgi:hypothetical protein